MRKEKIAVGIDIGGTKIVVGIINSVGRVLHYNSIKTETEKGFADAVGRISTMIECIMEHADLKPKEICGIGIGCAGPVASGTGIINNPFTLKSWAGCDIITPIKKKFNVPVLLENDADTAAFGEYIYGSGKKYEYIVMLTLGTGVGSGIIINGAIYRASSGEHPELGHIFVREGKNKCYCGIYGCLESLVSGTAIAKAGSEYGFKSSQEVFAAAKKHEGARIIIEQSAEALGLAVWNIVHSYMPDMIILGGGMIEGHFDFYRDIARRYINESRLTARKKIILSKAKLGNKAGMLGAAGLIYAKTQQRG